MVAPSTRQSGPRRVVGFHPVPVDRLIAVYAVLVAGLLGLGLRLAWLQIADSGRLLARARAIQTQSITPIGKRRTIVDRGGRLVALDEQRYTLWAHPRYFNFPGDKPQQLRTSAEVAARLAAVLARPKAELITLLGNRRSGVKLATDLDPETAQRVRQLGISGLDLEAYPERIYPQGSLFANVVGFLNLERVPQAGLEQSRDSDLRRHEDTLRMMRGADGTPLPEGLSAGSLYGDDLRLQLTLDARLQQVAQQALARQIKHWNAKRGADLQPRQEGQRGDRFPHGAAGLQQRRHGARHVQGQTRALLALAANVGDQPASGYGSAWRRRWSAQGPCLVPQPTD